MYYLKPQRCSIMYHVKLTLQTIYFYSLFIYMDLDRISIIQNDSLTQSIVFHFKGTYILKA